MSRCTGTEPFPVWTWGQNDEGITSQSADCFRAQVPPSKWSVTGQSSSGLVIKQESNQFIYPTRRLTLYTVSLYLTNYQTQMACRMSSRSLSSSVSVTIPVKPRPPFCHTVPSSGCACRSTKSTTFLQAPTRGIGRVRGAAYFSGELCHTHVCVTQHIP